ncbi:hypothetical protein [Streptomyces sp. NPDC017941]|uniref:hypothetical protein n=1 Tax=Streptomyces sp. NPDC017941 TaxID=3365018 RepID=UPI0037BDFC89
MEQDAEPRLVIRQVPHPDGRRRLMLELSAVTYRDYAGPFTLLGMCRALDPVGIGVGIIEAGLVAGAAIDRAGLTDHMPLRRAGP